MCTYLLLKYNEEHADLVGAQNILERFLSGQYGAAFKAD